VRFQISSWPARACAAVFFLHFLLLPKESGAVILLEKRGK